MASKTNLEEEHCFWFSECEINIVSPTFFLLYDACKFISKLSCHDGKEEQKTKTYVWCDFKQKSKWIETKI